MKGANIYHKEKPTKNLSSIDWFGLYNEVFW